MNQAIKSILSLSPDMISIVSIGLAIIGVIMFAILLVLCFMYMRTSQILGPAKPNKPQAKNAVIEQVKYEPLPFFSGRVSEILALNGAINIGPITRSFFMSMEAIKESTFDVRWRYKMPCYIIMGPSESGKSALLNNLQLESLTSSHASVSQSSHWKLFKKAAVFEVPAVNEEEDEKAFWSFLGDLFTFVRPRRPIDGIIVTLPADMLLSNDVDLQSHANEMFEKIFSFQKGVNFRAPIYLLVTKSDLIPGMQDLIHELTEPAKHQIFGWSSPYNLKTSFSLAWLEEIFSTLKTGIRRAVLNISKTRSVDDSLVNVVLFEENFKKIIPPLSLYLETMFRAHNPEDGVLLRGLYFVGEQREIQLSENIIQPNAINPDLCQKITNTGKSRAYDGRIFFANELFDDKIFRESNLATPINEQAVNLHKHEFRNKMIFSTSAIVFSFGWFYGNNQLQTKINQYYKVLFSTKTSIAKIRCLDDGTKNMSHAEQISLNNQTVNLLHEMPVIHTFDLISIFVPQSWFSSLRQEITDTIGVVFDSVVVRSMFLDLKFNAQNMLQDLDGEAIDWKKKDLFDVNSFSSFIVLKEFMKKIQLLEKLSTEYNAILKSEDRKSVTDLVAKLFHDKPEIIEFISRTQPVRVDAQKFDVMLFRDRIEGSLKKIFETFLTDVLDESIDKILKNVADDLEHLSNVSGDNSSPYSTLELAKLYEKIVLVEEIFKNKNFAWVARNDFEPTPEYKQLLNEMNKLQILSEDFLKHLLKKASSSFINFKEKLAQHETKVAGKLLNNDIVSVSTGVSNMKKEIKTILDMDFMRSIDEQKFVVDDAEDKMLIWDTKKLKELAEHIDKYNGFLTEPKGIRKGMVVTYSNIIRKCLYPSIEYALAAAQRFDDIPLGASRQVLEDAYLSQARNMKEASLYLSKIAKTVDFMQKDGNEKDIGFIKLVVSQASKLLERVDALFNLEKPYAQGVAPFDGWNGEKNAMYLGISEKDELKQYLMAQLSRIKSLAQDLASPAVDVLSIPSMSSNRRNVKIIEKWKAIIKSVSDYEQKKPGNSIAALESFVSDTLSKISIDTIDAKSDLADISEQSDDYFISQRASVARSLLSRADIIKYEKAVAAYNALSEFFNKNLAHKFPINKKAEEEMTLEALIEFIALYETSTHSKKILEKNREEKGISMKAIHFLRDIEKAMPILKTWVTHSKATDKAAALVFFNVQTRPLPKWETNTSAVVERHFQMAGEEVGDNTNAVFFNKNLVEVKFAWVASAKEQPDASKADAKMIISGPEVSFAFMGNWGILRLMSSQIFESKDSVTILKFDIPIVNKKTSQQLTTKVFMSIIPMMKNGEKLVKFSWPDLPQSAPDLLKPTDGKKKSKKKTAGAVTASNSAANTQGAVNFDVGL